ncbi:MAG: archaeal heat shock protein Hsp20 [Thermoplasmata archaeon]
MVFRKRKDKDDDYDYFDDFFFEDFDEEFRKLNERIMKIFNELSKHGTNIEGPFVYGFSMRIGPDGRPMINEFGNLPGLKTKELENIREPLVDINEDENYYYITAEIPGVEKDQINLEVNDNSMIISVDVPERKYYKELEFPTPVKPDTAKATYHNGILDIKIEKKEPTKKKGKKINIE